MKHRMLISIVLTLLAAFLLTSLAIAQSLPPVPPVPVDGNFVVDELNWLTSEQEAEINRIVGNLDTEGIAQIGVLTKDDCGSDVTRYRYEVFNMWGIGHANKNNGLLIAVCWYEGDQNKRTVAQEVGYGLEGSLPDTLTNKVAKEVFRPFFSADKPGSGLVAMVQVYDSVLRGGNYEDAIAQALEQGQVQPLSDQPTSSDGDELAQLLLMPICGLQCIWWLLILGITLLILYFWAVHEGYITPSSGSSSGWSSSSSDSDSGSSSSFGGGSSGGGGSNTSF